MSDRKRAIEILRKERKTALHDNVWAFDMAIKALEQEPRRGHWIKVHPLQENDEGDYMCSECRCGGLVWKPTTYCPNCGCRMVEPQESEEQTE